MKNVAGIWLPVGDTHIAEHLMKGPLYKDKGTYQYAKIEACVLACEAAGRTYTALDVGAHVGTWTRILADTFKNVVAFEPMHHLFECLERNTEGLENVELENIAVSNENGWIDMIKVVDNSGNCRVAQSKDRERTKVRCVPLDDVQILRGVDFIKIDVEGYETAVLKGARETIQAHKPFVMIEQKPGADGRYGFGQYDALELLKSWGMIETYQRSGDHLLRFP